MIYTKNFQEISHKGKDYKTKVSCTYVAICSTTQHAVNTCKHTQHMLLVGTHDKSFTTRNKENKHHTILHDSKNTRVVSMDCIGMPSKHMTCIPNIWVQ
jgi:hypothetical protein